MPTLGGVSCDVIRVTYKNNTQRVEISTRPGINGIAAQLVGLGDTEVRGTAVLYASHGTLLVWESNLFALKGAIVTIVDDWGNTLTSCLITDIGPLIKQPAIGENGGNRGEMSFAGLFK